MGNDEEFIRFVAHLRLRSEIAEDADDAAAALDDLIRAARTLGGIDPGYPSLLEGDDAKLQKHRDELIKRQIESE